jgi:uncharacterized repeat protein (TIGR03803 family)
LGPGAWAQSNYKTLYKFTGGVDGGVPYAGLVVDQTGNLYGTTSSGGAYQFGNIFELTRGSDGGWKEKVIHDFAGAYNGDGAIPLAGLVFDGSGNLYGTTTYGGDGGCLAGCGTVFELTPNSDGSWTESVLHSFCRVNCDDGAYPTCGLALDQSGNLYGTTTSWGKHGGGTAFELTPISGGSWVEHTLSNFCSASDCSDGSDPEDGLVFDQHGNLYGTTYLGGKENCQSEGCGTVFELTPTSGHWARKVLRRFSDVLTGWPRAGLVLDRTGNLYGTTFGTAFKLAPNTTGRWAESVLHWFCYPTDCRGGAEPAASLVFDAAGNLYGTAEYGGDSKYCSDNCGVVFKLAPDSRGWKETVLHIFDDHPGAFPVAALVFDAAGNLYGTTEGDGTTTFGSVFQITP